MNRNVIEYSANKVVELAKENLADVMDFPCLREYIFIVDLFKEFKTGFDQDKFNEYIEKQLKSEW